MTINDEHVLGLLKEATDDMARTLDGWALHAERDSSSVRSYPGSRIQRN